MSAELKRSGEEGITLVEVMVSVALFFLLIGIGSRAMYFGEFWNKRAEVDQTVINAKTDILQMLDCNTSVSQGKFGQAVPGCNFDAAACGLGEDGRIRGNNYVILRSRLRNPDRSRRILVDRWNANIPLRGPSKTTVWGRELDIRAGCGCCSYCVGGKALYVEYRRLAPNPDPVANFKPLFGDRNRQGQAMQGVPLACVIP